MGRKGNLCTTAAALGLSEYAVKRMAKDGKIPYLKSGVKYIFDIEQCEEYLKNEAVENMKQPEPVKQYGVLRRIEG